MKSNFYTRIIIPALLFLICGISNAQHPSPPWAWAKAFYGTNALDNPAIAVDPGSGAVYTTGTYFGTVDFDPGEGVFNLDSLGLYADMFISKLDGNGNFVWAKQISAAPPKGSCRGYSIAVDPSGSGDVYTTGAFHGFVDFDPGPGTFILEYSGYSYHNPDIFVSKLDSSGNFKWAIGMGGTGVAWGRSIAIDPLGSGDVYILGSFNGTIDFNPGSEKYQLTSNGDYDFFIAKLDRAGNFLWAKSIGGTMGDFGFAMALDPTNTDVYITGDFTGQVDFNPGDSSNIFTSGPAFDIFILKLDSAGNFIWVKPMYGAGSKGGAGYGITIDPNGSGEIYTTGYFEGEVDFDPDAKGIYPLNSVGLNDVFISKLDRKGNFIWAKAMGGRRDDKGSGIAFDPEVDGGVFILGNFTQTTDFDPSPALFQMTAVHSNDIFISKLNGDGDFQWAKPVLANQANQNSALAIDGKSLYMTGLFLNPTISFDSLVFLTNPSDARVFWDVYVAKLNSTIVTSVAKIKEHAFDIYPNPANNELTIEFEGDEFQDLGITMYNILGEVVYSSSDQIAFLRKAIDISTLASGLYFVEINVVSEKVVKKIVKE